MKNGKKLVVLSTCNWEGEDVMKKKYIMNYLILMVLIAFSLSISGCSHEDKETVINPDVKALAKQEKNQVKKNITLGNKLLNSKKYDDAKKAYNKAIRIDKTNKQTYLTIKDKYLANGRIQDAADIIQEAINNKVDISNMKLLLSQMKAKLEVSKAIMEYNERQNNRKKTISQKQNVGNSVSINTAAVQSKRVIGFVKSMYKRDGKRYLTFHEVQFYRGTEALREAIKDNAPEVDHTDPNNPRLVADQDYYIRNNNRTVKEYEISNSCGFGRQDWNSKIIPSSEKADIMYERIKDNVNSGTDNEEYSTGCQGQSVFWLTFNNNVVVEMDGQDMYY